MKSMQCNICSSYSSSLGDAMILGKYRVNYYSCDHCGFIQTEPPYWLAESYSSAIARSDLGLIGRNIRLANFCSALLPMASNANSSFLDYGGGNGMFVRMMRDKGFDFYWRDKYATNQFAEGFEMPLDVKFSALTAFEVFEHLPQPLEIIEDMLNYSNIIVFSTRLIPYWRIQPEDWWYFTLDTGQHVSLYSRQSLQIIADKFRLCLSSNGISIHVLSPRALPGIILKALSFPPFAATVSSLLNLGRISLLDDDYYRLTGRKLTK